MQFCILEWTSLYEFDPKNWEEPSNPIKPDKTFYVNLVQTILDKSSSVDFIPLNYDGTNFLIKKEDLHFIH
jgi:hypothetical protein